MISNDQQGKLGGKTYNCFVRIFTKEYSHVSHYLQDPPWPPEARLQELLQQQFDWDRYKSGLMDDILQYNQKIAEGAVSYPFYKFIPQLSALL